jgi:membrane protease YdiL (CAAX protease family)
MTGNRVRVVQALLVFAGWVLVTGLADRAWTAVFGRPVLIGDVQSNYLVAVVFVGLAIAGFGWRDIGLNAPRSPRSLLMLWFPALYVFAFFVILGVVGLPPTGLLLSVFLNTALAGISEELACRGVLYQGLRSRLAVWPAALLSSGLFGACHLMNGFFIGNFTVAGAQAIAAFMTGMTFMAIRIRTGSLYPGIILHALWDFGLLSLLFVLMKGLDSPGDMFRGVTALALLSPLLAVLLNFLYGLFLLRHAARDEAG